MTTGSPVWLSAELTFVENVNLLQFDYQFTSSALGLLSVYFEDELVFLAEEASSSGTESSGWIWLGADFGPGNHELRFLLEPTSDIPSILEVSALQFGYVYLVPEPAGLLPLMAVFFFLPRTNRRRL